jgi:hypothetical protein
VATTPTIVESAQWSRKFWNTCQHRSEEQNEEDRDHGDLGQRMTSIEFKINFLSGATPDRGDVVANARVVRRGKTIAVVHVDLHQQDVHVATGLFTYLLRS